MRITTRMPSADGVGAGQTATFKLPIGRRYHELLLTFGGTTMALANMTEIRVNANGKPIHRYSAVQLDKMNQFDGRNAVGSGKILVIPFDRYGLATMAGRIETALNTGLDTTPVQGVNYITSLTVEIDINSEAEAPLLDLIAIQSDRLSGVGAGTVLHRTKHTYSPSGKGEFEISDLPRGNNTSMMLNRIAFIPSANDINSIKIDRNNYNIFDRTKALNELIQRDGERVPQSGYVVVDRTEQGFGGDPISLLQLSDYRYKLDMSGACTLTILSEYLGRLGD